MFLVLKTDEAEIRNRKEAINLGLNPPTLYKWKQIKINENQTALDVRDGEGLTDAEIAQCVETIE